MPAAAVIPAPIAYINVVAVKKLVVGFWACPAGHLARGVAGIFPVSLFSLFPFGGRVGEGARGILHWRGLPFSHAGKGRGGFCPLFFSRCVTF